MIATTKQQGRMLMTAGVRVETADMVYGLVLFGDIQVETVLPKNEEIAKSAIRFPAWSMAALWDIIHGFDETYEFNTKQDSKEIIEDMVSTIYFKFTGNGNV